MKCFHKRKVEIPQVIADNENIIRVIFHPLFFSDRKGLKEGVFLPNGRSHEPEQRRRVSCYRRDYSTDNACKNAAIGIKMGQQTYKGFVAFINAHLIELNELPDISVKARMIFSPIDELDQYINIHNKQIFTDDRGIPMHSEILYDKEVEMDNPNTDHRLYAKKLIEITKNSIYVDKSPSLSDWRQEPIVWRE